MTLHFSWLFVVVRSEGHVLTYNIRGKAVLLSELKACYLLIPLKNPRSRRQGLTIRAACGLGRQNDFQFSRSAQKKGPQAVEEVSEG
jgi:hypothetical protein